MPRYCYNRYVLWFQLCKMSTRDDLLDCLTNNIDVFLQSVSDYLAPLWSDLIPYVTHCTDEFIIEPYRPTVERKLSAINTTKSCGLDNIPNWILRDSSVWLAKRVYAIFNESARDGIVPTIWKKANVVPIPKTSPSNKIESDLRPIFLTPTLSKMLESIVLVGNWILEFVTDKLDKQQLGAIKCRSTTHALVDILHHWHQALDNSDSVRVMFIDYTEAFDHVDHSNFVHEVYNCNVPLF
jgi:Reverse transcriptase (RNA-dependent DNA polymerase)